MPTPKDEADLQDALTVLRARLVIDRRTLAKRMAGVDKLKDRITNLEEQENEIVAQLRK